MKSKKEDRILRGKVALISTYIAYSEPINQAAGSLPVPEGGESSGITGDLWMGFDSAVRDV